MPTLGSSTGDMSWVMRIQNETNQHNFPLELSMPDITNLFVPGNKSINTNDQQQQLSPTLPPASVTTSKPQQHELCQSPQEVSFLLVQLIFLIITQLSDFIQSSSDQSVAVQNSGGILSVSSNTTGLTSRQDSKESVDDIFYDEEKKDIDSNSDLSKYQILVYLSC